MYWGAAMPCGHTPRRRAICKQIRAPIAIIDIIQNYRNARVLPFGNSGAYGGVFRLCEKAAMARRIGIYPDSPAKYINSIIYKNDLIVLI